MLHTCSEMCLQIRGSVCMKSEQVLFSFDLVALRCLRWLGSLASLLYLWPGFSWSPFQGVIFGFGSFWLADVIVLGGSSGSAEFWMRSIHCITSFVIPHPLLSPEKLIIDSRTILRLNLYLQVFKNLARLSFLIQILFK